MSKESLTKAYQEYVDAAHSNDEGRLESAGYHLFQQCKVAAEFILQSHFASNPNPLENGPYYDVLVDKFLHFTKPEVMAETRPETFNSYFLRSLKNAMIDVFRKENAHPTVSIDHTFSGRDRYNLFELAVPSKERVTDDLREVIKSSLKEQSPKLLAMYRDYIQGIVDPHSGMTYKKMGDKHGVPIGTVKSRIHKINSHLQNDERLLTQIEELVHADKDKSGLYQLIEDIDTLIKEKETLKASKQAPRTERKPHFRVNSAEDHSPGRY